MTLKNTLFKIGLMKTNLSLLLLVITLMSCTEKPAQQEVADQPEPTITFDSLLAAETGADEYGMRRYVMAFLKAGHNRSQDSVEAAQLQRAHMDNIVRMAEEGKLIVAGPFLDGGEVKGIYVFAVETVEEAEALTNSDPAIQAGRLEMELHPWYGSAALMKMYDLSKKVSKKGI